MSEMVERVAKAMAESEGDYTVTDHWRRRARSAIAAMREPTRQMINAPSGEEFYETIWKEMIDAALEEK